MNISKAVFSKSGIGGSHLVSVNKVHWVFYLKVLGSIPTDNDP